MKYPSTAITAHLHYCATWSYEYLKQLNRWKPETSRVTRWHLCFKILGKGPTLPSKASCLVYPCRFFHGKTTHGGQKKLSTAVGRCQKLLQPSKNVNSCENNLLLKWGFSSTIDSTTRIDPFKPKPRLSQKSSEKSSTKFVPPTKKTRRCGAKWPSANSASISDSNLKLVDMTQFQPQAVAKIQPTNLNGWIHRYMGEFFLMKIGQYVVPICSSKSFFHTAKCFNPEV